jgi:glycosyltransferase 2 family protein
MSIRVTTKSEVDQQPEENLQPLQKDTEQQKVRGKRLKLILRTIISITLLAFLLKAVSWSTLFTTLAHSHQADMLMGLAVGILCIFLSAYSWHALVQAEHISTDLARLVNLYLVGIAFSHFLPSSMGGDVAKAYYVGRDSGNMVGSTSAVLMSRITGFIGMLLITIPVLLIWHARFNSRIVVSFLLLSLLLVLMIVGAIFIATLLPQASNRLFKGRLMNYQAVVMVIEVGQTLNLAARRSRALCIALGFSVLFWIASFLNYYGYAKALGVQVPFSFYIIAISLASIVAFFPVTINGFGLREGVLVYAFSTVHVSASTALLVAFLIDIQVLLFGLIGGCIYLSMGTKLNKNQFEVQDEQ